ncbi:hypothetical protein AGLY_000354 [Aphis glycines]|uniref:Uncharacterized protein n=1 Tax=Aphis glycines TaxID=307491 RepID=A0A6G0U951_APHGL|nr:hypothetical protein AGLY_000354 [Aphis glycines]
MTVGLGFICICMFFSLSPNLMVVRFVHDLAYSHIDINLTPGQIALFKYAPITLCDVERSFSQYKSILRSNRRMFLDILEIVTNHNFNFRCAYIVTYIYNKQNGKSMLKIQPQLPVNKYDTILYYDNILYFDRFVVTFNKRMDRGCGIAPTAHPNKFIHKCVEIPDIKRCKYNLKASTQSETNNEIPIIIRYEFIKNRSKLLWAFRESYKNKIWVKRVPGRNSGRSGIGQQFTFFSKSIRAYGALLEATAYALLKVHCSESSVDLHSAHSVAETQPLNKLKFIKYIHKVSICKIIRETIVIDTHIRILLYRPH